MDYEKKYNEALERAKKLSIDGYLDAIAVEEIFPPEESEDERARKAALEGIEYLERKLGWDAIGDTDILDVKEYLEKQKENPKNAISIPADCASNAKCPYKIHGDEDFIGDIKDTPAYHFGFDEGVRSEREKQKEQKPAEWSEEDEKMRDRIIDILNRTFSVSALGTSSTRPSCLTYEDEIAWLKSLRPSWKPSEEQIQAIKYIVSSIPPNYLKEQKYTMGLVCEVISNLEKL